MLTRQDGKLAMMVTIPDELVPIISGDLHDAIRCHIDTEHPMSAQLLQWYKDNIGLYWEDLQKAYDRKRPIK
jgi:hypothetical protein